MREQHNQLKTLLELDYDPVGVCGRSHHAHASGGTVAAPACTFWRSAERVSVIANAADHAGCRVGAHVMGFHANTEDQRALEGLVRTMDDVSYLDAAEASSIPRLPEHAAWHYAPLAELDSPPDLVVLWLKAQQMMLVYEALGGAHWKHRKKLQVTGRPACGALALAYQSRQPVVSFGCAGMRIFTEIPDHYLLFVVPGARLHELCVSLAETVSANMAMQMFYRNHKDAIPR